MTEFISPIALPEDADWLIALGVIRQTLEDLETLLDRAPDDDTFSLAADILAECQQGFTQLTIREYKRRAWRRDHARRD